MERNYQPSHVKLFNSTSNNMGLYLWMKSRQVMIRSADNTREIMSEFNSCTKNWFDKLDDQFYVGNELVSKTEYKDRIDKMNLQYNNCEFFLFKITGSCLFRDICYNFNESSQWAVSNRFMFSILDESSRLNPNNYAISAEYKGIKEWELQFDQYMEAIKLDSIVDHNRKEMPYSISDVFWWGITKMQLLNFLGLLRDKLPFFYKVYGVKIIKAAKLNLSTIPSGDNPSSMKYMLEDSNSYSEKVESLHGIDFVSSKMGLILYSQFIRQIGTTVQGLYDFLSHSDVKQFSHRVFKGDTVINMRYIATRDKAMKTVSNRLCAFAMSSGNDPCSWNYFIQKYIPNLNESNLAKYLPCTISNNKVVDCKFKDDIKFRNEGKELSNCPCPLMSRSLADATTKKLRDNNPIGDAFYGLTDKLIHHGLRLSFSKEIWTSQLDIYTKTPLDIFMTGMIESDLFMIQDCYRNKFHNDSATVKDQLTTFMDRFNVRKDYTAGLKGFALGRISKFFEENHIHSYLINFGGDILGKGIDEVIPIQDSKFQIKTTNYFAIFTSSNIGKRGAHIRSKSNNRVKAATVIADLSLTPPTVRYNYSTLMDSFSLELMKLDLLATKVVSGEGTKILEGESIKCTILKFNYEYKLMNSTYCASPFFNDEQVQIRDNMASSFVKLFRPDKTKSSIEYDINHNSKFVSKVVNDNINGITGSEFLVFPKHTSDLGTLFELGVALANNDTTSIIVYDEKMDSYSVIMLSQVSYWSTSNNIIGAKKLFDCSKKIGVISMGFASQRLYPSDICYTLNGCKDNIMLSTKFTHVELDGDKYKVITRNTKEHDK